MKKVIASILTIVLSIPLFVSTPLANTVSQSYTTGYGSYYFTYNNDLDTFLLQLGNLGGVNMKGYCQSLIYEFNDTYSGYLDIHLLSESIWNNATIITENCYVKGKNSAQWDYSIGFKDVTSIKVTVVLPTLTTNNAWSGNKMALTTNYNITRDITSVEDYLEDIETTLGTVDAQLSTMTTSLSNIYGVENASRQLLSEIEYAIRGNNTLYVLSDDMGTIITDLNSIISNINNMNTNMQKLIVQNNIQDYSYKAYWQFNWYLNQGVATWGDYVSFYPSLRLAYQNGNYNYQAGQYYSQNDIFVFISNRTIDDLKFISSSGVQNVNKTTNYRNSDYNYMNSITFNSATTASLSVDSPLIIVPLYLGPKDNIPDQVNRLLYNNYNNTYTRKLDEIKNAINNMSMNVNQLSVYATGITYNVNSTQVDNSVTTYNTNINQVYNIENNFGTQLDTQLQNYNPDNTTIISRLTASGNIMKNVLNSLNGIELFTVPITVMLVGIVLLAIVG